MSKLLRLKFWFLLLVVISLSFTATGCYWHWRLRNPAEVPPQLKWLVLDTDNVESHFRLQLLNLFKSMNIHLVSPPQSAPFTLHAYNYVLTHDNPPVASTNVAITYTYTLWVTVSLTDSSGKIVLPPYSIIASRQITVNTSQIFTINSTSIFQEELQREAINLIYYWLTSEQTHRKLIAAKKRIKDAD